MLGRVNLKLQAWLPSSLIGVAVKEQKTIWTFGKTWLPPYGDLFKAPSRKPLHFRTETESETARSDLLNDFKGV